MNTLQQKIYELERDVKKRYGPGYDSRHEKKLIIILREMAAYIEYLETK